MIPDHLQVKNVSARSGRVTFITNGIQSGSSTAEIAASTKHKSMETLAGYAQKTYHIMGATGLSIAKRANELRSQQVLEVSKPQSTNLQKNFADEVLPARETLRAGEKLGFNGRNFKAHNLMTVSSLTRKVMESRCQLLQNPRQPPPSTTKNKFASQRLRFLPLRQLETPRLLTRTIISLSFGVFTCWIKLGNLHNEPD